MRSKNLSLEISTLFRIFCSISDLYEKNKLYFQMKLASPHRQYRKQHQGNYFQSNTHIYHLELKNKTQVSIFLNFQKISSSRIKAAFFFI